MKRHAIEVTAAVLGALFLAAITIELLSLAGLVTIAWRIGAVVGFIAVFLISAAALLVTNTRRPAGIDPNAAPRPSRERDPFGETTDELRKGVLLPDSRPYGRRDRDDLSVVKRLAAHFEADDSARPTPAQPPAWALDLMQEHGEPETGLTIPPIDGDDKL